MNMFKAAGGVLASVLVAVILLIPDTAVLGGFVADLANGEARYSVTSAFGLLGAVFNWLTLYFSGRPTASTQYSFGAAAQAAAQAAAAAAGLTNPNANIGVGSPVAPSLNLTPPAGGPTMPNLNPTGWIGNDDDDDNVAPVAPPEEPADDGFTVSTLRTARGGPRLGGRRKQVGGASYALNPSSILGIPIGSKAQPAGLAVLVAIAFIYSLDASMGKRYGSALVFQILLAIAIVAGYTVSYANTEGFGSAYMWVVPIVCGMVAGGIGYGVMQATPRFLPLDPENAGTPTGEYSKCAKAGGNGGAAGEYVCDAYLNGQRIGTVSS
jgi:hypothetical protein